MNAENYIVRCRWHVCLYVPCILSGFSNCLYRYNTVPMYPSDVQGAYRKYCFKYPQLFYFSFFM